MPKFTVHTLLQNSYDGLYLWGESSVMTDVNEAVKLATDVDAYIANLRSLPSDYCQEDWEMLSHQDADRIICIDE
jgi:hypothetical protein